MGVVEARPALARDFVRAASKAEVPPLSDYLADFVPAGCEAVPDDFRLVPLTPPCLRLLMTSSDCLTDCMFELQAKYQQFIPSDWGGHMEKGWRDLAVIGFNIEPGPILDIQEIHPTTGYPDWAEPKLNALQWERLLIRTVVEFGRACDAQQVRLLPAHRYPLGRDLEESPSLRDQTRQQLKRQYDDSAQALGFEYDPQLEQFVLPLA